MPRAGGAYMAGGGVEDLDAAGEAPLPWSLPMILPLYLPCRFPALDWKSLMSRGEWALEEGPGPGGRRGVVPGAPTGSTPGAGFHGGGRSPGSRVGRTESDSRRGVLLPKAKA